jgi:hypothetical protein
MLLLLGDLTAFAQTHLALAFSDPAYLLLEVAEIRGALPKVSGVKPYPLSRVLALLLQVREKEGLLTPYERKLLQQVIERLTPNKRAKAKFSLELTTENAASLGSEQAFSTCTAARAVFLGDLMPQISFNLDVGQTVDLVNSDAFLPYEFTKPYDGQGGVRNKYYPGSSMYEFYYHTLSQPELVLSLLDGRIFLRWARFRRQWGIGDGSLLLSDTARPFDAIEFSAEPLSWLSFSYLTGSLGYYLDKTHEQKMFTAHMGELNPLPWLYLSMWEAVIWGKRLELAYLNPFSSYAVAQVATTGDLDNLAMGADLAIKVSPYFRWYFSLFLDEFNIWKWDIFFENPMNMYAFSTGLKAPFPWVPFGLLTLQYRKIEPYCYTHYPQVYPFFTDPININFTNDGENLGYHLPPNSDELLLGLRLYPVTGLDLCAQYHFVRHGTGHHLAGQIEGDIGIWIDYSTADPYPRRDFLHDGIYEYIHVAQLTASWSPPRSPWQLCGSYGFSTASTYENIPGNRLLKHTVCSKVAYRPH